MHRDKSRLEKRRLHCQKFVNEFPGKTETAVNKLADKLFLSPATIWKDLRGGGDREDPQQ